MSVQNPDFVAAAERLSRICAQNGSCHRVPPLHGNKLTIYKCMSMEEASRCIKHGYINQSSGNESHMSLFSSPQSAIEAALSDGCDFSLIEVFAKIEFSPAAFHQYAMKTWDGQSRSRRPVLYYRGNIDVVQVWAFTRQLPTTDTRVKITFIDLEGNLIRNNEMIA